MASQKTLVDKVMEGKGTATLVLKQGSMLNFHDEIQVTDDPSRSCMGKSYEDIGILGVNGDYLHIEGESLRGPKDNLGRTKRVSGQIPLKDVEDVDYAGIYHPN